MPTSRKPQLKNRYRRLRAVLVLWILLLSLGYVYWDLFLTTTIRSDDAYVSGNVIPVQALVPGVVIRVDVDNSMVVHAGQPLIEQEQNLAREHLDRASAALALAVRQIRSEFAQADQSDREITVLQVERRKLVADLARYAQAEAGGAVSSQKVADTRDDIAILDRRIAVADGNLRKARALVVNTTTQDNPLVLQKRAELIESYIEYHRAIVAAPVDGYVANRRAEAGQQVSPGQLLLNVIPLHDLWVTANLKETQMGRIRPGQPVRIVSHSYGDNTRYHGRILGIEPAGGSTFSLFPPDNSTGNYIHIVERVPVRISLDSTELDQHPLRPGMSVSVDIDTAGHDDAPVLHSDVAAGSSSYSTALYRDEAAEANRLADRIIHAN